jgi:hypothetical protein
MRLEGEIGWKTTMVLLRAVFVFQNSAPVSNFSKLKIILHSELGHMCIDFIFFFFFYYLFIEFSINGNARRDQ